MTTWQIHSAYIWLDLRRCPDGQRFANLLMSCCKAAKVALSWVEQEMPFPSHSSQHCLAGGRSPVILGGGGLVRASCQVIWIIFPTSAKFTYQICNFACGYRCRCSCSWSRAKVACIYSQLYSMSVCLTLPPPTGPGCLAAAKDAFRVCFWLDSDSTWMKMFARIQGINKCTPCASQCVSGVCVCVRACLGKLSSFCPCLECLWKRSHACEPQFELWTWEN